MVGKDREIYSFFVCTVGSIQYGPPQKYDTTMSPNVHGYPALTDTTVLFSGLRFAHINLGQTARTKILRVMRGAQEIRQHPCKAFLRCGCLCRAFVWVSITSFNSKYMRRSTPEVSHLGETFLSHHDVRPHMAAAVGGRMTM